MAFGKKTECNLGGQNNGEGGPTIIEVMKAFGIMYMKDGAGANNFIDLTTATGAWAAYFTALINQADKRKRLYSYPEVKNVEDLRDDPVIKTWNDDSINFVRDGIRKVKIIFPTDNLSIHLVSQLESLRCAGNIGLFAYEANGTMRGRISEDGTKLYPIRIDEKSIAVKLVKPQDKDVPMIEMTFNFHSSEKDCSLGEVIKEEMDDIEILAFEGLMDVHLKTVSVSTIQAKVILYNDFGTSLNKGRITGLLVADFVSSDGGATSKLYNKTDDADVIITSVSEVNGEYTLNYAAQTVADILIITAKKNGFDFTDTVEV